MSTPQIHWHEGLFLQPHHLQRLQKHMLDQFGAERKLAMKYPYGLIEAKLSPEALKHKQLRFERLKVVMPGGAILSYPENTDLPSLDISAALAANPQGFEVRLGLPIWFGTRGNTIEGNVTVGARIKQRYRVCRETEEVADENTGDNPQPLQFRRYNAMLVLGSEDRGDLDTIPLLRVVREASGEDGYLRQDPDYVPPSLLLSASPVLRHLVTELTDRVKADRESLANSLARAGDSQTIGRVQVERALRLGCLNRYVARMPGLLDIGGGDADVPPFDVYQEMVTLLADLMAIFPDRMPFGILPYRHEDPYPCFRETAVQIRKFLEGARIQPFMEVKFNQGPDSVTRILNLESKHFTEPTAWYLGIKTTLEASRLVELIEDMEQFKLLPPSYLQHAIGGIPLSEERRPPFEFAQESGRFYFRLNISKKPMVWSDAREGLGLAVRWTPQNTIPDMQFSLFMTLPTAE